MSPRVQPAGRGRARRDGWTTRAGCLAYVLFWVAVLWIQDIIGRHLGWLGVVVCYLLVAGVLAVIQLRRTRRSGQTIAEAVTAGKGARRRLADQEQRRRAEQRERARHEAALPWLKDKRRSPGELSGVVITPTSASRHHPGGHDVVLDSSGDRQIEVIGQLRRLTGLSFEEAKDLLDIAPVPVLRVPDMPMAQAAKYLLESAGAAVSITDPAMV